MSEFRCAVIGYGGAFNMGRQHLQSLQKNEGFVAAAVCDLDAERVQAATEDFPGIATFTDVAKMLDQVRPDLVTVITPHNTHCPLALQCLNAGAHVVVEKPMALNADEVAQMISTARKQGRVLTTFHNRRWDGDHIALMKLIRNQHIGRIFRIDAGMHNYGKQRDWWRSDQAVSGGAIFDWGAHFTDWMLRVVDDEIRDVSGYTVKHPDWSDYDNEDHAEMTIRFAGGCRARLTISHMAAIQQSWWCILGEHGSISKAKEHWLVRRPSDDGMVIEQIPFAESDWDGFYRSLAAHLRDGAELQVTPESAGRVINALDACYRSAAAGGDPVVPAAVPSR